MSDFAVMEQVLQLVAYERVRQEQLKEEGRFSYTCADILPDATKLAILMEEVGEVAREVLTQPGLAIAHDTSGTRDGLQRELVQVAAVAVAWAEAIEGWKPVS